ncbi:MAG: dienelactone hydrolase family protein [Bryobacteraceae bacterium]|nr:dienelactone hydrolase family protein [Bryobacteraceae bacterium]
MSRYIAFPRSGSGAGVLVLHACWGLTPFYRELCDRLALEDFVALAPDLYEGRTAATEEEARKLRHAKRKEPALKLIVRGLHELAKHDGVTTVGIGVLGFSMGGDWALRLAAHPSLPVSTTVTFYAARGGDFRKSRSAFLAHFAETDPWVPTSSIAKMQKSLKSAGREFSFQTYAGTRHWFFEKDRPEAFDRAAAELAWTRTMDFLRTHLK